jgi:hypothetical protein
LALRGPDAGIPPTPNARILAGSPTTKAEDREIRFRDGTKSKMRTTTFPDGMSYADTQQFIQCLPVNDPRRHQFVTGTVDMKGYLSWLNAHGYGLDDMTVH